MLRWRGFLAASAREHPLLAVCVSLAVPVCVCARACVHDALHALLHRPRSIRSTSTIFHATSYMSYEDGMPAGGTSRFRGYSSRMSERQQLALLLQMSSQEMISGEEKQESRFCTYAYNIHSCRERAIKSNAKRKTRSFVYIGSPWLRFAALPRWKVARAFLARSQYGLASMTHAT